MIFFLIPLLFVFTSCGPKSKIQAVKAIQGTVSSTVSTTSSGTVEARTQSDLAFGVTGIIAKVHVKEGDRVEAGSVLAELLNADFSSAFTNAKRERERAEKLFKSALIASSKREEVESAYQLAYANYEKSIIRAPFSGMVVRLNLPLGEFYGPSVVNTKHQLTLVDQEKRIVKGPIDETDLRKIKVNQLATVRIPSARLRPFSAKVSQVVSYITSEKEQDRTAQIELSIDQDKDDSRIPVGGSADVEIIVDSKDNALMVPTRSLISEGEEKFVFVVDGSSLVKTLVKVGIGNYERSEILSGIQDKDVIAMPSDTTPLSDGLKVSAEIVPWP